MDTGPPLGNYARRPERVRLALGNTRHDLACLGAVLAGLPVAVVGRIGASVERVIRRPRAQPIGVLAAAQEVVAPGPRASNARPSSRASANNAGSLWTR